MSKYRWQQRYSPLVGPSSLNNSYAFESSSPYNYGFEGEIHDINHYISEITKLTSSLEQSKIQLQEKEKLIISMTDNINTILDGNEYSTQNNLPISNNTESALLKCIICLTENKCVLLNECKHVTLCETCVNPLIKDNKIKCPVCRTNNESWHKIFLT